MKNLSRILLLMFCCSYQSLALAITCNDNIPESTPAAAFDLSATDGMVVHNPTALMWSRCALGQTWNQGTSACDGAATAHTWTQALTEANNSTLAGFTDWRLPNIKELSSIVEQKCVSPAINETVFPGTPSSIFWSASAFAGNSSNAWDVNFNFGDDFIDLKNFTFLVRLVRGGQLFDSFDITNTFTIGGMVSGLSGSGLVLQNNAGDDLPVAADGAFTFATPLADGSAYSVSVFTQPSNPNETCTVSNGSGNLAGANVTNVTVTCTTNPFTVGGVVSGLAGAGLVLQNNGGDNLSIAADGAFTFPTPLPDASAYSVSVFTQPSNPSQSCTVSNGSGNLAGANVTNVTVTCTTNTFTIGGMV